LTLTPPVPSEVYVYQLGFYIAANVAKLRNYCGGKSEFLVIGRTAPCVHPAKARRIAANIAKRPEIRLRWPIKIQLTGLVRCLRQ
jgi:hypothetical protein